MLRRRKAQRWKRGRARAFCSCWRIISMRLVWASSNWEVSTTRHPIKPIVIFPGSKPRDSLIYPQHCCKPDSIWIKLYHKNNSNNRKFPPRRGRLLCIFSSTPAGSENKHLLPPPKLGCAPPASLWPIPLTYLFNSFRRQGTSDLKLLFLNDRIIEKHLCVNIHISILCPNWIAVYHYLQICLYLKKVIIKESLLY